MHFEVEFGNDAIGKISEFYADKPVLQSLLRIIPYWGSADSLLKYRAEELRTKRIRIFFDELASGQQQLTEEIIDSDDFLHCYFSTLRAAQNSHQKEKIKIFARLLKCTTDPDAFSNIEEFEDFLDILDSVSYREFVILSILRGYELKTNGKHFDNQLIRAFSYWNLFKSEICTKFNIPENEFDAYMTRIERTGLYSIITGYM